MYVLMYCSAFQLSDAGAPINGFAGAILVREIRRVFLQLSE